MGPAGGRSPLPTGAIHDLGVEFAPGRGAGRVCVCEEQAASAYHLANLQVRVVPGTGVC